MKSKNFSYQSTRSSFSFSSPHCADSNEEMPSPAHSDLLKLTSRQSLDYYCPAGMRIDPSPLRYLKKHLKWFTMLLWTYLKKMNLKLILRWRWNHRVCHWRLEFLWRFYFRRIFTLNRSWLWKCWSEREREKDPPKPAIGVRCLLAFKWRNQGVL